MSIYRNMFALHLFTNRKLTKKEITAINQLIRDSVMDDLNASEMTCIGDADHLHQQKKTKEQAEKDLLALGFEPIAFDSFID